MTRARRPTRKEAAVAMAVMLCALLACGGGEEKNCSGALSYRGKQATATATDRVQMHNDACRVWCQTHDGPSTSGPERDRSFRVLECTNRCGADVVFGEGTLNVTCR